MATTRLDLSKLPVISPDDDDETFWQKATDYGFVRPEEIDPDQAWFWTRSWIAKEIEADVDYAEGRFTTHYSDEEFLAALEQWSKVADAQIR